MNKSVALLAFLFSVMKIMAMKTRQLHLGDKFKPLLNG